MNLMAKSIMMISLIMMTMFTLTTFINKKSTYNKQKSSPFECGFNPMCNSRTPFSIHFFLIGIIFLIFDIEIVIIMPMVMTMKNSLMTMWMMTSWTFIMILLAGLYHEWNSGMMKWAN